nr:MAG TPA: hypothetical protein [Caudoviricetes sp.]
MRVLSAGKFRAEKFLPLLHSASVQLYVSFSPPKARSRVRVFFSPARFASAIVFSSSPAPAHPAAGQVLLPQPGGQSAQDAVVLRLFPGVAVGLPQRRVDAGAEEMRVEGVVGHRHQQLRAVRQGAARPCRIGTDFFVPGRAAFLKIQLAQHGVLLAEPASARLVRKLAPRSQLCGAVQRFSNGHFIAPFEKGPAGRSSRPGRCLLLYAVFGSRDAGGGPLVLHLAVLQHLGHLRRHLHLNAPADLIIHPVDADEQILLVPAVVLEKLDFHMTPSCPLPQGPTVLPLSRGHLVRGCAGRVARHTFNADHVLLHQTLGGAHSLPAHGRTLVQRVITVAQLLDDVLQTAAFQLGHAVGVGAQHQRAEHGQTRRAGGVLPDLRLAGLDEADVAQLADLAPEHGLRVRVLVHLDELLAGLQVVGSVGVDDGDVAVADGVGVHGAKLGGGSEEQLRGQGAGLVQIGAALHNGLGAVRRHLGRIDDIGAAGQHIAGDAVHGAARLTGQHAGGLYHIVVDGGHLQLVGQRGPAAVLVQIAGDGGHVQGLTVGGHALGQRGGRLGQAVVLAELDGLAAVLGHRVVIRKLVMDEARLGLIDEALLIEGLHLGGHAGGAGGVVQRGRCVGEQLEVDHFMLFHNIFPFFVVS